METATRRRRDAWQHRNFRALFFTRLASQFGDGLLQAALISSVVFSPTEADTAAGFAKALALVYVPFSLIGPFTGVFIDRWRRKQILIWVPLIRMSAGLVLLASAERSLLWFTAALVIFSANRFFLATAATVVPRLVPPEDLLTANSLATIGGTLATFTGIFLGGVLVDSLSNMVLVAAASVLWLAASAVASSLTEDLAAERPRGRLHHELREAVTEFIDGIGRLTRAPMAVWPITSISLDQFVQGFVLVLSLFVFRERWSEGVGSFSWLIAAGGVGIFAGLATVGRLEPLLAKTKIVALSFLVSGVTLLATTLWVNRGTVLFVSFLLGMTFAWKKVPIDTLVQEAVEDRYRGRVFSVYDVAYNLARVLAAVAAIWLIPVLGVTGSLLVSGALFVAWSPVLPAIAKRSTRTQPSPP